MCSQGEVWEDPECGSFCPWGAGVCHPLWLCMCSPTWKLSKPHTLGISRRFRHMDTTSFIPFLALLPSQECGEWSWKCPASSHSLVFLVTRPHPGVHPESPQYNTSHSYHPGNFEGFRSPVLATGVRDQVLEH